MGAKKVLQIGPTNGWLFGQKIYDLPVHQKLLDDTGANAVELVMYLREDERQKTLLSGQINTAFVSVHLDDYYKEGSLYRQVMLTKEILDKHMAAFGVLHPVDVPSFYYESLTAARIPVSIENMDKNMPSGYHPRELLDLMERYDLGFVLDSQHAYERDPEMQYAWDLFWMGRTRLRFLHVSGQDQKNVHSLVYKADNVKKIVEFVGKIISQIQVPIILEGQYTTAQEVKTEIEFLKQEFGF